MGTGVAIAYGKISEDMKTIHYTGTMTDPVVGGDVKFRSVLTFVSKDKSRYEMFGYRQGKEYKIMEMVYSRAK